jgi:hypothetical protein
MAKLNFPASEIANKTYVAESIDGALANLDPVKTVKIDRGTNTTLTSPNGKYFMGISDDGLAVLNSNRGGQTSANNTRIILLANPLTPSDAATKQYVDDAISNVGSGSADLSNYYTKTEVDDKVGDLANTVGDFNDDISDLYTKKADKTYVDELVGDIDSALTELHNYARALIEGGNS